MPEDTYTFVKKYALYKKDPERIRKSVEFCRNVGFADETVIRHRALLKTDFITLEQRYFLLEEGGMMNIDARMLANFLNHMKQRIGSLKAEKCLEENDNLASNLIKHLNPKPKDFTIDCDDYETFSAVYFRVLKEYLKWRLQARSEEIEELLATHPNVYYRSLRYVCENIAIALELGFSLEKILNNGYILRNYPKYTREIQATYPYLAGVDINKAMRHHPKLTNIQPSNIAKIFDILQEYHISEQMIANSLNVFLLSPETVRFRLQELENMPEFRVLLKSPKVLLLIVHHNRAKMRLHHLKRLQLRCAGVRVLGNNDDLFDTHIRDGHDRHLGRDVYEFFSTLLKRDAKYFQDRLKQHPFYLYVPFLQIEETFNYLRSINFSIESILNAIPVLLYPKEQIDLALDEIELVAKSNGRNFNQTQTLNLVIYFIEKEHHFTGNGIWRKSDLQEDIIQDTES